MIIHSPSKVLLLTVFLISFYNISGQNNRWSAEKANNWLARNGWLRGSDFIPSDAINQLEMWQPETFNTEIINRELGWAESIGMNCMRVYLHHLAWQIDRDGFKERIRKFLSISDKHGIKIILVFFDDCWNASYEAGKQPESKPGIHNSGWVQDPGSLYYSDASLVKILEAYVKDILTDFKNDQRIVLWDLYNEPGGNGYGSKSMVLLEKVFQWGREINPSQPLTAGIWNESLKDFNAFQAANSDIITYHNYGKPDQHKKEIDDLRKYNRPLVCTEYMARTNGSTFGDILPMLKKENIGAINWGLVSGKTNTIYRWDDKSHTDGSEPVLWFHDIFRKDGTPYKKEETDLIRNLCSGQAYTNPIINYGLADPNIKFDNGFYYLLATGKAPDGRFIPIYRSKDLITWDFIRGAVDKGKETDWNYKNFWAPEVYKIKDKFYLYYTASPKESPANSGNRVGLAVSDNIEGPYQNIGIVVPHASIDGHLFFDKDSSMYIFYTIEHGNKDGFAAGQIFADRMISPSKIAGKPVQIISHHPWQEGPFVLHRDNLYYLTYSCGNWTDSTYHIRYALAKSILGPYTEQPNTILKTNKGVKGPGHHSFFKDKKGQDWIVYHGWDPAHTARYSRIDRIFFNDEEITSNGPTFTPQFIDK